MNELVWSQCHFEEDDQFQTEVLYLVELTSIRPHPSVNSLPGSSVVTGIQVMRKGQLNETLLGRFRERSVEMTRGSNSEGSLLE